LDRVPSDDPWLSPMQLWCNGSQERYVLGVRQARMGECAALCERERCPFAAVGVATEEEHLTVGYGVLADTAAESISGPAQHAGRSDHPRGSAAQGTPGPAQHAGRSDHPRGSAAQADGPHPIDLPMDVLFGKAPKMHRDAQRPAPVRWRGLNTNAIDLHEAGLRVLAHPTVAAKQFLITIGDRAVGGLTARDQLVGPWQMPVADCALTLAGYEGVAGEAMAIGERTPLALIDAAAAARMAVGEAITNLCAAPVEALARVKLSANWMAAAGHPGEDAKLFDAVHAVGMELCPELGLGIPVGKDSLSMQVQWNDPAAGQPPSSAGAGGAGQATLASGHKSVSPVSLIVTAFAPVPDVTAQLTPLIEDGIDSELWLIGLGSGKQRLGGSILAQCFDAFGGTCPDLDDP